MDERMQWTGDERRDGGERRIRFEQWAEAERRESERRRGGVGTHHADPTAQLLDGVELPQTLAFEPAAGTTGDQIAASNGGSMDGHPERVGHSEKDRGNALAPAHQPHDAIPSSAAIAGHPLHPSFVPLPIGAFAGALAADIAYAATKDPFFARAARLLTLAGMITGALAAVLGGIDFFTRSQIRSHRAAWLHAGGNAATLLLGGVSLGLRSRDEQRAASRGGLVLSALSGLVLVFTGWLGGELSYRHRIGMTDQEEQA